MDELLEQLRWLLNLPVGATAEDVKAQLQKLIDSLSGGQGVAAASVDLPVLLSAQRDILSLQAIGAIQAALDNLKSAINSGQNKGAIRIKAEELQFAAEKWLKPYPHAAWRENVEVLLVALAVAMGIRTFFLQPFKIPTGSMQPTLFGVNSVPNFARTIEEARNGFSDQFFRAQFARRDHFEHFRIFKSLHSVTASYFKFPADDQIHRNGRSMLSGFHDADLNVTPAFS